MQQAGRHRERNVAELATIFRGQPAGVGRRLLQLDPCPKCGDLSNHTQPELAGAVYL